MVNSHRCHPPLLLVRTPPFPYYVECGRSRFAVGEAHPSRQQLGMFDLLLVTRGMLHIGEEDSQWSLGPGDSLILLPDRYHYAVMPCEVETDFFWVHFQAGGEWVEIDGQAEGGVGGMIMLPKRWHYPDLSLVTGMIERLRALSVESRTLAYWEEQAVFWDLLRLMSEGGSPPERAQSAALAARAEAYIKRNYAEEITNEVLAEALHFHPNYIARCMKQTLGFTPMAFLHEVRIQQAKLLLLKTEWPVTRIAEQVGFRSAPYFSSCFKQSVGVPPLAYRKQYS
jgi:AraC-like DNA-binding protein